MNLRVQSQILWVGRGEILLQVILTVKGKGKPIIKLILRRWPGLTK